MSYRPPDDRTDLRYAISASEVLADAYGQCNTKAILLMALLRSIQKMFPKHQGSFCGYGIADDSLMNPNVEWNGNSTYIQQNGIDADFGLFDSPDAFYAAHSQKMGRLKKLFYSRFVRHRMNRNIQQLRKGK